MSLDFYFSIKKLSTQIKTKNKDFEFKRLSNWLLKSWFFISHCLSYFSIFHLQLFPLTTGVSPFQAATLLHSTKRLCEYFNSTLFHWASSQFHFHSHCSHGHHSTAAKATITSATTTATSTNTTKTTTTTTSTTTV